MSIDKELLAQQASVRVEPSGNSGFVVVASYDSFRSRVEATSDSLHAINSAADDAITDLVAQIGETLRRVAIVSTPDERVAE